VSAPTATSAKARAKLRYCEKDASARFRPLEPADRHPVRHLRTSVPVDYEGIITNASDGSVARYYDPSTGQFLSLDPAVSFTQAPFNYAGDDPVNGSDPSGLSPGAPATGECAQVGGTWINNPSEAQAQSLWFGHCLRPTHYTSVVGQVVHFLDEHKAAIAEIAVGVVVVVVVTLASGGLADAVFIGLAGASAEVSEAAAGGAVVGLLGLTFPLDAFFALAPIGLVGLGGAGLTAYGIYELFQSSGGSKPAKRGCP
jgi:RHS repeat-associated protein